METNFEKKVANYSLILIGASFIIFGLIYFQSFLRPFIISIILTILIIPAFDFKKNRNKKITYWILGIFIFILMIYLLGTNTMSFISQSQEIQNEFNQILEEQKNSENVFFNRFDFNDISSYFFEIFTNYAKDIFKGFIIFLNELILILLFMVFLIPSYKTFSKNLKKIEIMKNKESVLRVKKKIEEELRTYLGIKTIMSLLTGGFTMAILILFSVNYFFILGILTFLLNYIPTVGSFFAVLIILILSFFQLGEFSLKLIILSVLLILVQFIIGNIVEPKVSAKKFNISPIIIILSLFFWGSIWGVVGMLFSVPITISLIIIIKNLIENHSK